MRRWIPLALIALPLLTPAPAAAQRDATEDPSLHVEVHPAFDGWYDPGHWVMLSVDVRNDGPGRDLVLRASGVRTGASYSTQVELPRGAHKQVPLYVRPLGENVTVDFEERGRSVEPQMRIGLRMTRDERLVMVLGDESAALKGLDGMASGGGVVRSISVRPEALPEQSLAMGSIDALFLAGADLSRLSEAQRQALHQWVALGGQLIVTGGPSAPTALGGLPETLLPATVSGVERLEDLGALVALMEPGDAVAPEGGALVARLVPTVGAVVVVATPDGQPLVVRRPLGAGEVVALAFDPQLPPISGWADLDAMWGALATSGDGFTWRAPKLDVGQLSASVANLPEFGLPSLGLTMLLLVFYILLVGPLNYIFLRRRRRLDLAWVTIPALTVAASGLIYGAGYWTHGGSLVVYEISSVHVVPDADVAHVHSFVGLFSPSSREYDVRLEDGLAYPLQMRSMTVGPLDAHQGRDGGVREFEVDQWSLSGFAVEAVVPWSVGDPGTLVAGGRQVRGTVGNPLGQRVVDAHIVAPGGHFILGDFGTGDTKSVTASWRPGSSVRVGTIDRSDARSYAQDLLRAQVLGASLNVRHGGSEIDRYSQYPPDSYYSGGESVTLSGLEGAYVFGWNEERPLDVRVAGRRGRRHVETFLFAPVPVQGAQDQGESEGGT